MKRLDELVKTVWGLLSPAAETEEFGDYVAEGRLYAARLTTILAAFLILGGWTLEWTSHPDKVWSFFLLRSVNASFSLVLLAITFLPRARRHGKAIYTIALFAAAITVELMVVELGGYTSGYYVGLLFCMLGFSVSITFTPLETAAGAAGMVLLWIIGANVGKEPFQLGAFTNNFFFLSGTAAIAVGTSAIRYEVAEREFNANKRLEALNQLKDQFFANVSHELRTPLTLILAPIENVFSDPALEHQRSQLDVVRRNAQRLLRLIDDLLDLSRLDVGGLRLVVGQVDLEQLVQSVVEKARPAAEAASIALVHKSTDSSTEVVGDPHRLEMVITNLIANAIKYTPATGTVEVAVHGDRKEVRVAVTDSGRGIPEEEVAHIFDRFYRVESRGRREGGVGIGLALAKELVELHGGQVRVQSAEGHGSSFSFSIPRGGEHIRPEHIEKDASSKRSLPATDALYPKLERFPVPVAAAKGARATSPGERPLVLVVEDQADLQVFVKSLLAEDYEVLIAKDGDEGWGLAKTRRPDLVLSDIMMPGRTGLELCRDIKADPDLKDTPVLLLTARTGSESEIDAYAHGADDFIPKPFHPEALRARVRSHVGLRLEQRKVRQLQDERIGWLENLARFLRHELKNQIVGVRTSLGLLNLSEAPATHKYVERAQESLGRMHRLVSSATEATSLEGALDAEQASRIQLSHVVADRVTSFEQAHPSLRFERKLDEEVWVSGNEDRLVQLLDKLLSNAVEHVDPDGQIRVSLRTANGTSCLGIENDGPPLPEDHEQIFTAFFSGRANAGSENLGLGLYVAKVIAESHGGTITASDLDNGKTGARFEVRFPMIERGRE